MESDEKYFRYRKKSGLNPFCFYTLYYIHNLHFVTYTAMFSANYQIAREAALKIAKHLRFEDLNNKELFQPSTEFWCESFLPILLHVLIRFGKWKEIMDEPFSPVFKVQHLEKHPKLYQTTLATVYYARGIACSVLAGLEPKKETSYLIQAK